jgi:predicted Zn-dependent peptidase
VAINIWYDVGSKHEQPGKTGFAHLFEHVMFQARATWRRLSTSR